MHCSHKTAGGESAYNEGVCSICDEACAHPNGFKNNSHACEACGAPCPHNSVNETGFCSDCEMQFKIKVTVKRNNGDIANTAWAESLNEALSFTSSDNYVELKLYRDTASEDTLTLQRCKKVDLNGKTLSSNSAGKILIASGTISFTDSSTGTPGTVSAPIGVYGALSVNANVSFTGNVEVYSDGEIEIDEVNAKTAYFENLTVCAESAALKGGKYKRISAATNEYITHCLAEGYAFCDESSTPKKWYGVNDNKESLENVTIKPVPIKAFTLTSDDERCILGKNAIITAELTLQDAASSCSYEWFDLTGGVLKTLPGTDSSITISAPALGKHTYECVVTVDGYKTMELIDITVEVCNHKNANGTVAFNEQTGICSLCDEKVVVSVANGSNIAYYTDIHTAISALKQGDALKLLQNVTDEGADGIKFDFSDNSMAVTVDLNGKKLTAQKLSIHNGVTMKNGDVVISGADGRFAIAPSARFTVEESGINVTGELQISVTSSEAVRLYGGSYTAINMVGTDIGKVLADDYGIRTEEGVWYTNTTGEQVTDVENVTVKKLPITAVSVTADKESYVYQDSGTLTATATLATGVTETPTYQWYRVYAGNEELMRKQTEQSYTFPSHTAGEFVYKCAVTVDGYSKVGELNLTVAPRTPVATEDFTIITGKVLTYNTKEQELVYTERNNVGTFHYRLGETGTWTTTYPKAKDADVVIYEIYWYLESTNSNYTDLGSEQNPQGPVYARINELDISKMDSIILSSEQTVDLTYTGAAQTPALSLSLKTKPEETVPSQLLEELTVGTDYALSNVTAQTEVGLYEATVTGRRNLKGETTVSWKISPAAAPTNAVATVEFYSNLQRSYSVDLSALLPTLDAGKSYGTLSGTIGTYSGSADITNVAVDQDNKLTFSVADSAFSTGTAGEAVINVRTQNYGNFDLTVKLNAKPRPIPTGNPALSKTEITYGESVGSVSFTSASMTGESGEEVRGTFAWKNGSATPNVTDSYSAAWEFTPEEGSVYDKASGTAQLKINPAALTNVSVTANELTYNGSEQTATVNKTATAVGQNSVTFTYSEDENGAYSENVPAFKNAGTYTVYYKASANNHVTADGSFTVKVNKRKISPIAVVENKVYDGTTDAVASIDFENLVKGESLTEEVDYSVTATFDNKNIGTRTAEVSVSLKETTVANNYELAISSVSESANISKKQLKITAATVSDKNYDGTTDATVTSVTFDGLVGNDSLVLGTDYTVDASFENKNVGENKKVTLRVITENTYATMNYSFVGQTFNNATATIIPSQAKAPAFNNKSAEYTGAAISHEPIEAPFTGVTAVSYTYVGIQGTVYESTSAAPTNSGVYIVTASFTMAEGYAQLSPATSTLIIRKASNTWIVEPSVSDWTYGESAKVTAGQSKFGTVKVSYKKQGEPDESYSDTVPTEAGEYNICFSVEGTDNYNDIILETSFEIKRKPVTGAVVGAFDSMTYSGDEQLPKAKVTLDNEPVTGDWSPVKNVSDKTNFTATGNFTGTISDKETSMAKATLKTSAENPTTAILRRGEALKYASIIEGDILGVGDMPVSGSFQWIDDEEVLNTSGKASVRFTEEKGNYEPLVFEIEVSTYSGGTGGGRRNDNIIVVVTENEDGSVTTTTTNKLTGTVTEETEWSDGSSLSTETRKNGNKTVIEKDTEGTVTEIKTDAKGNTTTTTKREDGVTVTTKETAEGEKTTEITVPKNKEAEITLPVSDADEIEKVIVTDKSGNKTEITDFEKSEGGHKH